MTKRRKLTVKDCDDTRWLYRHTSMSMEALGKRFKVSPGTIARIIDRKYAPMSNEQQIEQEIQAKGLNAPRLTPAHIDATIIDETYTVLPSGKTMVCELTLINGFTVRGDASVVSKENFNEDIGRKVSREKARDQIWQLEGYLLQDRLFRNPEA